MADQTGADADKPAIGGDLVVPALGLGLAAYFLVDIADVAWEARANATVIACVLLALIGLQLARITRRVMAGEATLGIGGLIAPRQLLPLRLFVLLLTGIFIITLPWLGLTLGLFLLVLLMMRLLRAGSWRKIVITAAVVSIAAYLLFIALLNSRMPHGPVEKLLGLLF
jgi:hypothetical protein